jgi:hypothetical protein
MTSYDANRVAMFTAQMYQQCGHELLAITRVSCARQALPNAGPIARALNDVQDGSFRLGILAGLRAQLDPVVLQFLEGQVEMFRASCDDDGASMIEMGGIEETTVPDTDAPFFFYAEVLAVFQSALIDKSNIDFDKIRKVMASGVARNLIAPDWTVQFDGPGKASIKWTDSTGVARVVTVESTSAEDQPYV